MGQKNRLFLFGGCTPKPPLKRKKRNMEKRCGTPRLGQVQHLFWTGLALPYGVATSFYYLQKRKKGATMKGAKAVF
jgi:hypothetical protein